MIPELEERKLRYIESVEAEHLPEEKNWWQHPAPVYHDTKDYAAGYDQAIDTREPVIFKKVGKEWVIAAVMLVVSSVLIYMIAKKEFGFTQLLFLVLVLLVVLPRLLDNKARIGVNRESIWLYKEDKTIRWEHAVFTYIKEVREEGSSWFFIIHYYDERLDEFRSIEMELDGLVSPAMLAATIEAFRQT